MRLCIIRMIVFLGMLPALTFAQGDNNDSLPGDMRKNDAFRKVLRTLIPTQGVIQNAGNMGLVSCGVGWDYGRRSQWETHLLLGYVPKHKSKNARFTITLKENFIPWNITLPKKWNVEPLECGMYVNAIFGKEFWNHQPNRYPNNYYWFSTMFRTNIFVGQRVTKQVEWHGMKRLKAVTAFYEISSCDLYIIDFVNNKNVGLKDMLGLSLGLKFQFF